MPRTPPSVLECVRCTVGVPQGHSKHCPLCNEYIDAVIFRARSGSTSNRDLGAMFGISEDVVAKRLSRLLRARGLRAAPVGSRRSMGAAL